MPAIAVRMSGREEVDPVCAEGLIARHDERVEPLGLSDDHPVERIAVTRPCGSYED